MSTSTVHTSRTIARGPAALLFPARKPGSPPGQGHAEAAAVIFHGSAGARRSLERLTTACAHREWPWNPSAPAQRRSVA